MSIRQVDETQVTSSIVSRLAKDFLADTRLGVAIVGAGPAGITAARLLVAEGHKTAIFERNLHVGRGMWGGGMLFPYLVIQEEAIALIEQVGIGVESVGDGYYVANSVECVSKCTAAAVVAGAPHMGAIFGGMFLSGQKAAQIAVEMLSS